MPSVPIFFVYAYSSSKPQSQSQSSHSRSFLYVLHPKMMPTIKTPAMAAFLTILETSTVTVTSTLPLSFLPGIIGKPCYALAEAPQEPIHESIIP